MSFSQPYILLHHFRSADYSSFSEALENGATQSIRVPANQFIPASALAALNLVTQDTGTMYQSTAGCIIHGDFVTLEAMDRDGINALAETTPAKIEKVFFFSGSGFESGQTTISALMSDKTTQTLLSYYSDELSFHNDELLGLTEDEARALKVSKDKAFIQG